MQLLIFTTVCGRHDYGHQVGCFYSHHMNRFCNRLTDDPCGHVRGDKVHKADAHVCSDCLDTDTQTHLAYQHSPFFI